MLCLLIIGTTAGETLHLMTQAKRRTIEYQQLYFFSSPFGNLFIYHAYLSPSNHTDSTAKGHAAAAHEVSRPALAFSDK